MYAVVADQDDAETARAWQDAGAESSSWPVDAADDDPGRRDVRREVNLGYKVIGPWLLLTGDDVKLGWPDQAQPPPAAAPMPWTNDLPATQVTAEAFAASADPRAYAAATGASWAGRRSSAMRATVTGSLMTRW